MPRRLERYQQEGDDHFITFSCYHCLPYLDTPAARNLFLDALESTRKQYEFQVLGYVVMPEHVHLLLSEPDQTLLGTAIQALKVSVSKRSKQRRFWQARYYDANIFSHNDCVRTVKYMHRNPVVRGLVENPGDWPWSSYAFYTNDDPAPVQITKFFERTATNPP
jgi:putative transposase